MKTLLIILTSGLMLVGCGKNVKGMKFSEMKNLSETERKDMTKDLTMEEGQYLIRGSLKYALDTNALNDKTIGDLIDEGKKAAEKDDKK